MENLVKTTTLRFRSEKEGFSAEVVVVKDEQGNIKTVSMNSIQGGDNWLGDLNLSEQSATQMAGISALLTQILTEAQEA